MFEINKEALINDDSSRWAINGSDLRVEPMSAWRQIHSQRPYLEAREWLLSDPLPFHCCWWIVHPLPRIFRQKAEESGGPLPFTDCWSSDFSQLVADLQANLLSPKNCNESSVDPLSLTRLDKTSAVLHGLAKRLEGRRSNNISFTFSILRDLMSIAKLWI